MSSLPGAGREVSLFRAAVAARAHEAVCPRRRPAFSPGTTEKLRMDGGPRSEYQRGSGSRSGSFTGIGATGLAALMKPSMVRVRLEAAIAALAGAFGILTPVWRDGIEALSSWIPTNTTAVSSS